MSVPQRVDVKRQIGIKQLERMSHKELMSGAELGKKEVYFVFSDQWFNLT